MTLRDRVRTALERGATALTRTDALPVAPHVDAAPMPPQGDERYPYRWDQLVNPITGLGGATDKGAVARPDLSRLPLSDPELAKLYLDGGLARRIVELLPAYAIRPGWQVSIRTGDSDDAVDVMAEEDARLDTQTKLYQAWVWARLFRYSVVLMVVDDDEDDLRVPLDLSKVKKLKALQVFDAIEARPWSYNADIDSDGRYRLPEEWTISPALPGRAAKSKWPVSFRVHASRVLYFRGARRPPSLQHGHLGIFRGRGGSGLLSINAAELAPGPDDSTLRAPYEDLRNLSQVSAAGATLAQELLESVLKISGLRALQTGDQAEEVRLRVQLMSQARSILGTMVIGEGDDYTSQTRSASGHKDLSSGAQAMLAASTGIPLSILFGFAPSGLSTDDKNGTDKWDKKVAAARASELRPQLIQLYEVAAAADEGPTDLNGTDEAVILVGFNPLDEPTEQEKATTRKTVAETDMLYINTGVLQPEEVRESRFGEDGYQFELRPVEEVDLGPDDPDDPAELGLTLPEGIAAGGAAGGPDKLSDVTFNGAQIREAVNIALQVRAGALPRPEAVALTMRLFNLPREAAEEMVPAGGPTGTRADARVVTLSRSDAVALTMRVLDMTREAAEERVPKEGSGPPLLLPAAPVPDGKVDNIHRPAPPEHRSDATEGTGVWVGVPLPPRAIPAWEAARAKAASVVDASPDEMDLRGHEPHITLLWVGKVDPGQQEVTHRRVVDAVDKALGANLDNPETTDRPATLPPVSVHGVGLGSFEPSEGSEGDTPLFMAVESQGLLDLNEQLSQVLLDSEEREGRPPYHPHVTVGYLPRDLTSTERTALEGASVGSGWWPAAEVHLSIGGKVVSRWFLRGTAPRRSGGSIGLTGPGGDDKHPHLIRPDATETDPGPDGHTHTVTPGDLETGPGGEDGHTHTVTLPPLPRA